MTPETIMTVGELFAELNDNFFGGRLPLYAIEMMPVEWEEAAGRYGECNALTRIIRLSVGLLDDQEELKEVLVHEMAHAAVDEELDVEVLEDHLADDSHEHDHEPAFLAELLRLLRIGAPVNPLEFDQYGGDGWKPENDTGAEKGGTGCVGMETTCGYCGSRVIIPATSGLARHWTMCPLAPVLAKEKARTSLKASIPTVRCVSVEEWSARCTQEERFREQEEQN